MSIAIVSIAVVSIAIVSIAVVSALEARHQDEDEEVPDDDEGGAYGLVQAVAGQEVGRGVAEADDEDSARHAHTEHDQGHQQLPQPALQARARQILPEHVRWFGRARDTQEERGAGHAALVALQLQRLTERDLAESIDTVSLAIVSLATASMAMVSLETVSLETVSLATVSLAIVSIAIVSRQAACSKIWSGSTFEWKLTNPTPQQRRHPGSDSSLRIVALVVRGAWCVVSGKW